MLAYPLILQDDDGAVLVTSPDFAELTAFGADREEAAANAVRALEEAIAARIHGGREIPRPSKGDAYAVLPASTATKALRHMAT